MLQMLEKLYLLETFLRFFHGFVCAELPASVFRKYHVLPLYLLYHNNSIAKRLKIFPFCVMNKPVQYKSGRNGAWTFNSAFQLACSINRN